MYSNVVTAIDKILHSYYVSTELIICTLGTCCIFPSIFESHFQILPQEFVVFIQVDLLGSVDTAGQFVGLQCDSVLTRGPLM